MPQIKRVVPHNRVSRSRGWATSLNRKNTYWPKDLIHASAQVWTKAPTIASLPCRPSCPRKPWLSTNCVKLPSQGERVMPSWNTCTRTCLIAAVALEPGPPQIQTKDVLCHSLRWAAPPWWSKAASISTTTSPQSSTTNIREANNSSDITASPSPSSQSSR